MRRVEPACAVLEISPSTYYAAKKREESPSARDERDEELKKAIRQARERRGRKLYGAKKMWRELNRDGIEVRRVIRRQDTRDLARIEWIVDSCARKYPEVGIQLVVDLGRVLEVVAVTYRLKADVARESYILRTMNYDPTSHRIPDRGVLHKGVLGRIGPPRLARQVKVDGIVSYLAALSQLIELDALYLIGLESLTNDCMATEVAAQFLIGARQRRKIEAGAGAA